MKYLEWGTKALSVVVVTSMVSFLGCSESGSSSSKTIKGKVRFGTLGNGIAPVDGFSSKMSPFAGGNTSKWGDAPLSNSIGSGVAKFDGIKLTVKAITARGSFEGEPVISRPNQEIEITSGTAIINFEKEADLPVGNYTGLNVELENKIALKGFCVTKAGNFESVPEDPSQPLEVVEANQPSKLLYTTKNGVKECSGSCGENDSLPSDYDYMEYDFIYMTQKKTDKSLVIGYDRNFALNEEDGGTLMVLVDTSYIGSCAYLTNQRWGVQQLTPFRWIPPSGFTINDYFPNTSDVVGHFGVGYMPIFAYIAKDGQAFPRVETYETQRATVSKPNEDCKLTSEGGDMEEEIQFERSLLTTIMFDSEGNIITAIGRGVYDNRILDQGWNSFKKNSDGTYVMMNGNHKERRWLQDRQINNFQPIDLDSLNTWKTFKVYNGPECHKYGTDRRMTCLTPISLPDNPTWDPSEGWNTCWRRIERH